MKKSLFICLFFTGLTASSYAQQFVYRPVNPAFGGDPFNYQWLLSSASVQNKFSKSSDYDYKQPSALESFSENLNRQILNDISRKLFGLDGNGGTGDGDGKMKPGVYNMGNLNIKITEYYGGLNINIIDITTGEQTNINIPNKP